MARLKLTRDQLALFLKDHESIKQFEKLFSTVDESQVLVDTLVAEAKATEALVQVQELRQIVDQLLAAPPPREYRRSRYGQFTDTTTQTVSDPDTPKAITYNTTDFSNGVYLRSGNSEIEVDTEGLYNFQFSVQLDKTSGGTAYFWIWPRVNGTDVPNSASAVQIQGNDAELILSANFFLDLKANDYVQFMFAVSDISVEMKTFASAAFRPASPSIIVNVSNNIKGLQ